MSQKHNVQVNLPHTSYQIYIQEALLEQIGGQIRAVSEARYCVVVSDSVVAKLYREKVNSSLKEYQFEVVWLVQESGEASKNLDIVRQHYSSLIAAGVERGTPLLALGGGVVGDLAGFVASTFLRGIPFFQCPTTLLSMVDASVGGKVGVNLPEGKNLVGSFYQPQAVYIDTGTLKSLPNRDFVCGLAECVKHGILADHGLFSWIEDNSERIMSRDIETLSELIARNVTIKAQIVVEDEKEQGIRAHLNLGHTFAHAIEACCGYGTIFHGEAVALGLVAAAYLGAELGYCLRGLPVRVSALLEKLGLPVKYALPENTLLLQAMRKDKKVERQNVRFILPISLGKVQIFADIADSTVENAWNSIRK